MFLEQVKDAIAKGLMNSLGKMNVSNFFTEKGFRQPPRPPDQIGKGDHNFYKERTGGGALKKSRISIDFSFLPHSSKKV